MIVEIMVVELLKAVVMMMMIVMTISMKVIMLMIIVMTILMKVVMRCLIQPQVSLVAGSRQVVPKCHWSDRGRWGVRKHSHHRPKLFVVCQAGRVVPTRRLGTRKGAFVCRRVVLQCGRYGHGFYEGKTCQQVFRLCGGVLGRVWRLR